MWKKTAKIAGVIAVLVLAAVIILSACGAGRALRVASSLAAHELCSQAFVARRDPAPVFREYVRPMVGVFLVKDLLRYRLDPARREVTASIGGWFAARAAYAEGRGCTVVTGARRPAPLEVAEISAGGFALHDAPDPTIAAAIERAFAEPPDGPRLGRKAIIVVADGAVLGERYAPGYGPDTPLQSWSMAKSVTNALIAVLVREGKLAVGGPAPVAAWRRPEDPRRAVTIDHLLRHTSGQPFGHSNSGFDRATRMLFLEPDTAGFSARATFEAPPGRRWSYTDGNYAILSGILRDTAGPTPEAFARFARAELFAPLGMSSAVIELDAAGSPMGAAWMFATARDWARFGLLYAHDGVVDGRRLLPEGWVAYSAAPTPVAELGYGAGFFTNVGASPGARRRRAWGAPEGSFFALGNSGQVLLVVPSHRLVIASLGFALDKTNRTPVEGVMRLAATAIAAIDRAAAGRHAAAAPAAGAPAAR